MLFHAKRPQRRGARGKRLFSQDVNNFIYIQLEITGRHEAQRNKTPKNYYSLFPSASSCSLLLWPKVKVLSHKTRSAALSPVDNNYFKARGSWIPGKQDAQGIVGRADKSLLTGEFVWLDFKNCLVTAQK